MSLGHRGDMDPEWLDDRTVGEILAAHPRARSRHADLIRIVRAIRSSAVTTGPRPSPELEALLASGLQHNGNGARALPPAQAGTNGHGAPVRPPAGVHGKGNGTQWASSKGTTGGAPLNPAPPPRRRRPTLQLAFARVASLGLAAKISIAGAAVAAATTGAGAAGVLPGPVQDAVADVVETVSPFELPSSHPPDGPLPAEPEDSDPGRVAPPQVDPADRTDGTENDTGSAVPGNDTAPAPQQVEETPPVDAAPTTDAPAPTAPAVGPQGGGPEGTDSGPGTDPAPGTSEADEPPPDGDPSPAPPSQADPPTTAPPAGAPDSPGDARSGAPAPDDPEDSPPTDGDGGGLPGGAPTLDVGTGAAGPPDVQPAPDGTVIGEADSEIAAPASWGLGLSASPAGAGWLP